MISSDDIIRTRRAIDNMGDVSNNIGIKINKITNKYSKRLKFAFTIATLGTVTAAIGFFAGLKGNKLD